jgi:hypothetical protein
MKHRILVVILLLFVLIMSGCSYRYDFVVVNKSDGPIQVQYRLKRHTPETPGKFVDINPPAKLTLQEFQKSKHEWQDLPKDAYGWDNSTGTFSVSVASDEVLLIDYTYNYGGSEDQFDLASIKITGAKGSIDLEGKQAQTQFKIESDTKYVLQYR